MVRKHLVATALRRTTASIAAAAFLATGAFMAFPTTASAAQGLTITPNPWTAGDPFEGWGTSLAWFANGTGNYGEPGSIVHSSGDPNADKKALSYGKQLKQQLYDAIFSKQGLGINMARFNIGGGNASDVAYGYPFMRQGAAVPGYWRDDPKATGVYKDASGNVSTKQADKNRLEAAFDPSNDKDYDWSKGSAQEWWLQQGLKTGDINHVEFFANSAPWFMTNSGYATGGTNAGNNNLADPQKFAAYLAHVVRHMEKTYKFSAQTVEPLNESETSYWGTPSGRADNAPSDNDDAGISKNTYDYYWNTHFADKNKSVTPYSDALKKPQEGMHVGYTSGDNSEQQQTIRALRADLDKEGSKALVSATDATNTDGLLNSYGRWNQETKKDVGQYNTHAYSTPTPYAVRDLGISDNKPVSMSEVDGSWQGGAFDPLNASNSNALGMAKMISSNVWNLQSKDFTFWQVVEDLYNMAVGSGKDLNGNTAKVHGENTNWGTVLADFDCNVAGKDGKLYSEREWLNNGQKTNGIHPCTVLANTKYDGVRAFTQFIRPGDRIIANNSRGDTMTALKGSNQVIVVHANDQDHSQKVTIDLSKFGSVSPNAVAKLYLTTAPKHTDNRFDATVDYLKKTSNVPQSSSSVQFDTAAKTATFTIPANSIASLTFDGVSGTASSAAPVQNSKTYFMIGKQSHRLLQASADGSSMTIENRATDADNAHRQVWTFHNLASNTPVRAASRSYVISSNAGGILAASTDGPTVKKETVDQARKDPSSIWYLSTEDGVSWELTNRGDHQAIDVSNQDTAAGTAVDLYQANAGDNQEWSFASATPKAAPITIQTAPGVRPELPANVKPLYNGTAGSPVPVTWDLSNINNDIANPGAYTVNGSAVDLYGTTFPVTAKLYVGAFTWAAPASETVLRGTSRHIMQEAAPSKVAAHVGDSPAVLVPVTWDWNTYTPSSINGITATVKGTLSNGVGKSLPATLSIIEVGTKIVNGDNLTERFCSSAQATSTEAGSGHSVSYTCDGKPETSWSNWNTGDENPTLTYSFDKAYKINSIVLVPRKPHEATPSAFKIEYLDQDGRTWKTSTVGVPKLNPEEPEESRSANATSLPPTKGIRVILSYGENQVYAKVGEIQIFEQKEAAADSTVNDLADLRFNGVQVPGFSSLKRSYSVQIDSDAAWPVVQAVPVDSAAHVRVEQPSDANKGVATVTVIPAAGSPTSVTTLTFSRKPAQPSGPGTPSGPVQPGKPGKPVKPSHVFRDVAPGSWYEKAVYQMADKGVMTGYADGTFYGPNDVMTREQAAVAFYRLAGSPSVKGAFHYRDGRRVSGWARRAVLWAYQKRVLTGYANRMFGPQDRMTREQAATALARFAGVKAPDTKTGFAWAVSHHVVNGWSGKRLDPTGVVTRAQMAQILANAINHKLI